MRRLLLILVLAATGYLALGATAFAPVDTHGARVVHLTIRSRAVGESLGVSVVVPPSGGIA